MSGELFQKFAQMRKNKQEIVIEGGVKKVVPAHVEEPKPVAQPWKPQPKSTPAPQKAQPKPQPQKVPPPQPKKEPEKKPSQQQPLQKSTTLQPKPVLQGGQNRAKFLEALEKANKNNETNVPRNKPSVANKPLPKPVIKEQPKPVEQPKPKWVEQPKPKPVVEPPKPQPKEEPKPQIEKPKPTPVERTVVKKKTAYEEMQEIMRKKQEMQNEPEREGRIDTKKKTATEEMQEIMKNKGNITVIKSKVEKKVEPESTQAEKPVDKISSSPFEKAPVPKKLTAKEEMEQIFKNKGNVRVIGSQDEPKKTSSGNKYLEEMRASIAKRGQVEVIKSVASGDLDQRAAKKEIKTIKQQDKSELEKNFVYGPDAVYEKKKPEVEEEEEGQEEANIFEQVENRPTGPRKTAKGRNLGMFDDEEEDQEEEDTGYHYSHTIPSKKKEPLYQEEEENNYNPPNPYQEEEEDEEQIYQSPPEEKRESGYSSEQDKPIQEEPNYARYREEEEEEKYIPLPKEEAVVDPLVNPYAAGNDQQEEEEEPPAYYGGYGGGAQYESDHENENNKEPKSSEQKVDDVQNEGLNLLLGGASVPEPKKSNLYEDSDEDAYPTGYMGYKNKLFESDSDD